MEQALVRKGLKVRWVHEVEEVMVKRHKVGFEIGDKKYTVALTGRELVIAGLMVSFALGKRK